MNSIVEQEDRFWLYSSIPQVPWIPEMQLEDILESDPFCVCQNIAVPFLICSVVLLYQGRGNISGIFYESVLDNPEMYFHQTNCIAWTVVFLPDL